MGLFESNRESDREHAVRHVEKVLRDLGVDVERARLTAGQKTPCWTLRSGSAQLFVRLHSGDEADYLNVYSPLVRLPAGPAEPLLRDLLGMNFTQLAGGLYFCIDGDTVMLAAERAIEKIDRGEVDDMIKRVARGADDLDDELAARFKVPRWSDGAPPGR